MPLAMATKFVAKTQEPVERIGIGPHTFNLVRGQEYDEDFFAFEENEEERMRIIVTLVRNGHLVPLGGAFVLPDEGEGFDFLLSGKSDLDEKMRALSAGHEVEMSAARQELDDAKSDAMAQAEENARLEAELAELKAQKAKPAVPAKAKPEGDGGEAGS